MTSIPQPSTAQDTTTIGRRMRLSPWWFDDRTAITCSGLSTSRSPWLAFSGERKQIRKATGCDQQRVKAALSRIGSRAARAELPAASRGVSVAHRFLRPSKKWEAVDESPKGEKHAIYQICLPTNT